MEYQQGSIGRVFVAKIEHGDDLLLEINKLAAKEKIKSSLILMIGALEGAEMVVGPKACTIPPDPVTYNFNDGREIVAIGTLWQNEVGEPSLHLHGSIGKDEISITGCIRNNTEVYLVVEVVILEILGINAVRQIDPKLQLNILNFLKGE